MKGLFIAWMFLAAGDHATTKVVMNDGREGNPILKSNPHLIAASMTAVEMLVTYKLKDKHPKIAKGLVIFGVTSKGFAVGWNLNQLR